MTIRYFGMLSEVTGIASEQMDVRDGDQLEAIIAVLHDKHPELKKHSYRVALNMEMAGADAMIHADDELALLPPFAGG